MKKKQTHQRAFTLAEVLITIGIIGVVAALTIPTLVNNYQTKSWATFADVFQKKLTESVRTMNVQGKLGKYARYNTTEGFVEELQKHFKINKVCNNDELMQCFENSITMNDEKIDMSRVKTSKHFGQDDWNTNILGLQFANGVTGLIAYNPNCVSNPTDNTITGEDCYALLYDTSAFSNPNELGKDLRKNANVSSILERICAFKSNGICFGTPFMPTPIKWRACQSDGTSTDPEDNKLIKELGIKHCYSDTDYWAGAVSKCGGIQNMPSVSDIDKLADDLYNTTGIDGKVTDITLDTDKMNLYGFYPVIYGGFSLWSNEEGHVLGQVQRRVYSPTSSNFYSANRKQEGQVFAVCLGD